MKDINKLFCSTNTSLIEVYRQFEDSSKFNIPAGIALVLDDDKKLIGTVTDGDIRRSIIENNTMDLIVNQIMQKDPIFFPDSYSINDIRNAIPEILAIKNRKSTNFLGKIILVNEKKIPTKVIEYHQLWEQKVATHRQLVVVGLGYVGLTMALVLADAGFSVTGVEINEKKVAQLKSGITYVHELGLDILLKKHINNKFKVKSEMPDDGDVYIISVGTPVTSDSLGNRNVDYNYLEDSCKKIGNKLVSGNLVILRSTVPVGTCRNFVKDLLESESNLKCGIDFHLSFAPERTAEGKALKELRSLPQIIGGYNIDSREATAAIFRDVTPTIVKVASLEVAEMAKLVNNTFRDYIFAYSNQIAQISSRFNIDVNEVINAANEGYPRDPVPLPSPGVGGPCLTKDPYIFASQSKNYGFDNSIFMNGRLINESMHLYIYNRVLEQFELIGKKIESSKILICGLAFKGYPETGDVRNSSGVELGMILLENVENIYGFDPVADKNDLKEIGIEPYDIKNGFQGFDAILFMNNHKSFEKINTYEMINKMNDMPIIFDGWGAFRQEDILSVKPSIYLNLSLTINSLI